MRAKKVRLSKSLRRRIFREGGYRCEVCGIVGREERWPKGGFGFPTDAPHVFLSIDHIVAESRGGSRERSNLRVLCTVCNTKKGTK